MKLTALLLCTAMLQVSAAVFSQTTLSFTMKNASVKEVLAEIEKSSNYKFLYRNELVDVNRKLDIQASGEKIESVLGKLFGTSDIVYKVFEDNLVVITNVKNLAQQKRISGTITDASTGEPIVGANVLVLGSTIGAVTDVNGHFSMEISKSDSLLSVSYLGYNTERVSVTGKSVVEIKLVPDFKKLDEVVVVGYGVQKKSDLTGSISQVKASDMENRTVVRIEQALQGKTAGVQIIQTSGAPGSSATVRIRGFSSNSSSDPLYVVDGLRTSDVGAIDPNNIESIEVLKDAASAAIYGAQAGNGVILITTKIGKKGSSKITYDYQYVANSLARIPKVLNAKEYVNYMTEGNIITADEVASLWDGTTNTNWSDVAFEKSITQKHNLGLQGGNDKGSYYLSLSSLDQNGIVKGDKDVYHRLTGMINADYKIKPWMKVGTTTTFEKWDSKAVSENSEYGSLLASVLTMDPLTPDVFDAANLPDYMKTLVTAGKVLLKNESGQYYGISRVYSSEQIHPMAMRDKTDYRNSGSNILGTMYSDFTPIKGLRITSKLGYRLSFTNNYSFNNIYYANAMAFNDKIGVSRTSSNNLYYQWENFANYDFSIGKSKVNTMAGISYSDATATSVTGGGNEITKDSPLFRDLDYLTATATKTTSGGYSYSRQFSYFGRFSYDYAGKYLLQASVRRDAGDASILPITNRWGTFPAFSAGYIISNERFYPKNLGIDYMKIRSSWGQNGSTGPLGGYAYQASITSSGTYPFYNQIAYQTASSPNRLNNTELKWETSEQLDFGFDIRALRDRLTFTFDYFDKKTKDLLVAVAPPYETGVSSVTVNAGDVSNKGFEFELGWTDRINDFSYSIRSNLATLKNNVTYLDPSISRIDGASYHTTTGITSFQVGEPVWYMRGYQLLSIDKATGDPVFKDQNADGVINDADKVKIGSAIPDYTYGITLTAAYKGFDITGFGTGSQGNNIFNALTRVDRPRGNKLKVFYDDRWTANHTDASRPRPNANGEDKYWDSNGVIFDGSYFKIKQIQIGYTLPQQLVRKAFISSMRMYVSFDDWFVFTKYPGMDPESSAGSTSAMGVDKGSYPTSKKAVFGINVTF